MAAIRSSLTVLLAATALAGCREAAPPPKAPATVESACQARRFEGSAFTICRYDRRRHVAELFLDGRQGRLRGLAALETDLGPRSQRLRFAMNAGMYDDRGGPIGLYVAEGVERHAINRRAGPGNFHMLPNGYLEIAAHGRVAIRTAAAYNPNARPRWATQSGPMLVVNGALHPAIQPNGQSLHVRNGVGVDSDSTAWFAISEEPVSFGRFARLFRDELGCANALFFDGTVSSLWDRPAGRQDGGYEVGPMVAVFDK
ncbi:MAG TPA: phosphodiester glycosidase family protein [Allosphingosinicella sp.]